MVQKKVITQKTTRAMTSMAKVEQEMKMSSAEIAEMYKKKLEDLSKMEKCLVRNTAFIPNQSQEEEEMQRILEIMHFMDRINTKGRLEINEVTTEELRLSLASCGAEIGSVVTSMLNLLKTSIEQSLKTYEEHLSDLRIPGAVGKEIDTILVRSFQYIDEEKEKNLNTKVSGAFWDSVKKEMKKFAENGKEQAVDYWQKANSENLLFCSLFPKVLEIFNFSPENNPCHIYPVSPLLYLENRLFKVIKSHEVFHEKKSRVAKASQVRLLGLLSQLNSFGCSDVYKKLFQDVKDIENFKELPLLIFQEGLQPDILRKTAICFKHVKINIDALIKDKALIPFSDKDIKVPFSSSKEKSFIEALIKERASKVKEVKEKSSFKSTYMADEIFKIIDK